MITGKRIRWMVSLCVLFLLSSGAVLIGSSMNKSWRMKAVNIPSATRPVIVLDPGHGGMDGGATGNSITEKEINLLLAQRTAELCEFFGFEIIMTRESDLSIHDQSASTIHEQKVSDLKNRLKIFQSNSASAVVSIHLNKYSKSYVHGAQVFYAPLAERSMELAQAMQESFRLLQEDNQREIKKADSSLFLLYNSNVNPTVLVECGFVSNPEEASNLKNSVYQNRIAMTICYTLIEFSSGGGI